MNLFKNVCTHLGRAKFWLVPATLTVVLGLPCISDAEVRDLNPWKIPFDGGKYVGYIVPNELEFYRFNQVLNGKKGAYLGVGTFRALYALGQGQFSHGFLFDYSPNVTLFNSYLIDLIGRAPSRQEFWSLLMLDSKVGKFLVENERTRTDFQIQSQLRAFFRKDFLKNLPKFSHALHLVSNGAFNTVGFEGIYDRFVNTMIDLYSPKTDQRRFDRRVSFLGSNEAYARLRNLVIEGRIQVLHGDFTGQVTVPTLVNEIKNRDIKISILDLSNLMEYLDIGEKFQTLKGVLNSMPFESDAQVIFTSRYSRLDYRPEIGDWYYHSTPPAKLAASLNFGFLNLDVLRPISLEPIKLINKAFPTIRCDKLYRSLQ